MTSWLQWDISDNDGENPLKNPGEFEFNLEFDYDPGDAGCDYDSNGDGYPGHRPRATVVGAKCTHMRLDDTPDRMPTEEELKLLEEWFLSILDNDNRLRQQIEACGLDQMCFEPDVDDCDD